MNEKLKEITQEATAKLIALFSSEEFKALTEKTLSAEDTGTFKMIVSSEHLDRQGEIVLQSGIDTTNYMKNAVVLNSHDYHGIDNIVGMTQSLTKEVIGGVNSTVAVGKFAPTESGQLARRLYEGGFLSAGSIGFIAKAFDAQNESIITQSEMLEWSFCSVPANAAALRLNAIGVTEEQLRSKGFSIEASKEKDAGEKAQGDPCTMDDGSEGMMMPDANGGMACVPKQQEAEKGAVTDELTAEQAYELKWQKLDPVLDIMDAFLCVYLDEATPVGQFDTLLAETIALLQNPPADPNATGAVASLAMKRKSEPAQAPLAMQRTIKVLGATKDAQQIGAILAQMQNVVSAAIIQASKLILGIVLEYGTTATGKQEIAGAIKASQSLTAIKTAIADLEKKLEIGEGEEQSGGSAPQERSEDLGGVATLKNLDDFLMARDLLKSVVTIAGQSLERMNEKMRKNRNSRNR